MIAHDFSPGFKPQALVLFDLDNCLSDDGWRIPMIRRDTDDLSLKWVAYHEACDRDKPSNIDVFRREMTPGTWPVFVTARPGDVAAKTINWIRRHLLPLASDQFMLIMRDSHDDHFPSIGIKQNAARFLIARYGPPRVAYDDRPDIVQMYKSLGIPAIQLKIHDSIQYGHPSESEPMPDAPPSRGSNPYDPFGLGAWQKKMTCNVVNRSSFSREEVAANFGVPLSPPERDKTAFDFLREGAETFRERNATYSNGYHRFGPVAAALFPEGLTVRSPEDWNRLAVFIWVMTKVQRYAGAFSEGGHADSALDLSVYAAMLRELTISNKETTA